MQRFQSHKIVEAAPILSFSDWHDGAYRVELESSDEPDVMLPGEVGDRILKMAAESGHDVNQGWLVLYPGGSDGTPAYYSWSPADVFTDGYAPVQPSSGKSKIAGYRELTASEIASMNAVKEHGRNVGDLVELMQANDLLDQRWIAIGRTHLQQGFMALTRAIARPEFF